MIISEIGQNWVGNISLAEKLIYLAKENGSDLVKFQLYDSVKLYGKKQKEELRFGEAKHLFDYGGKIGIEVFFSVFDAERVKWCEEIGVHRYKMAFSQKDNLELYRAICYTHKDIFISCCPPYKVPEPYTLGSNWIDIKMLHCVPKYPATIEDYHLPHEFVNVGISDHTIGLDLAKIAIVKGAKIIEKHFAIDHHTGVDAEWSMTPDELKELKRWEQICVQLS